jgi:hypothetical protein
MQVLVIGLLLFSVEIALFVRVAARRSVGLSARRTAAGLLPVTDHAQYRQQ